MKKLEMLGYFWIFITMSLSMGLYKLDIRKRVIDEEFEYINLDFKDISIVLEGAYEF